MWVLLEQFEAAQHATFVFGDYADYVPQPIARPAAFHVVFGADDDVKHSMSASGWQTRF